jgi:hypothetical protein
MITYNLTTAVLGISAVIFILWLIRKHSISVRYTFWWIAVCAGILAFSIFPRLSDAVVKFLGIGYPPAFIFFVAILLLFVKTLFMDIDRSNQEIRIKRLIQRLAILEADLERERERKQDGEQP